MQAFYTYGRYAVFAAIIGINTYTMATPFLPAVNFDRVPETEYVMPSDVPVAPPRSVSPPGEPVPPPPANRPQTSDNNNYLYIPSLQLKQVIYEGTDPKTVNKGVWRRPHTSTPELGSNTAVAGHRFSYRNKYPFYHLDQVKIGDTVHMDWNKRRYTYTVTEKKIVSPNEVSVEEPTSDERVTIYTCTPLITFTDRLVIVAVRTEE
jgi:LPXTG-site transpeptidase (sortase) family protein